MNWLILTLISVVIISLANIIQKILMREDDSDPITYAIAFHFLVGLMVLLVALPFGYQLPNINQNYIFFLLSALSWGLGTVLFYKALQLLESSEVTIIISSRVLITIAASLVFLNESFSAQKIVGTLLILSSVFL
ncbi:MAG: EamA family transporter, partial [Microgenomates group bacterium]